MNIVTRVFFTRRGLRLFTAEVNAMLGHGYTLAEVQIHRGFLRWVVYASFLKPSTLGAVPGLSG